ncbi:MAG: capsid cement protein, partial [Candidatus Pacearchaeota archaeon]
TSTQMGCAVRGIFDMTAASGASITVGQIVSTSGPNLIKTATEAEIAAGKGIGKALETAAVASSEVIEVFVGQF